MFELERLKAEMERQDIELEACFAALRRLDPETEIAVSTEWLSELSATVEGAAAAQPTWALRV